MHTHGHQHNHSGHTHNVANYGKAFLIAIIANGSFVIVQTVFAYKSQSTSLLADAVHNLGDVFGLILAWLASDLIKRAPTTKATYGLKKVSILSALANGILLVFSCGVIVREALSKLFFITDINALSVIYVASIGILINGATAILFLKNTDDLNIRGAYLHLLYDAFISLGVVLSAVVIYYSKWIWIDPLVSIAIALLILKGTWSLFSTSFKLIIDGVPEGISWSEVSQFFLDKPGVENFHDLHIWALSTLENALSIHLYMPDKNLSDETRNEWIAELNLKFKIQHITIQIEKTETCTYLCNSSNYI